MKVSFFQYFSIFYCFISLSCGLKYEPTDFICKNEDNGKSYSIVLFNKDQNLVICLHFFSLKLKLSYQLSVDTQSVINIQNITSILQEKVVKNESIMLQIGNISSNFYVSINRMPLLQIIFHQY